MVKTAVLLCAVVAMAFLTWRGQTRQEATFKKADRAACVRIEKLKALARTQLERALTTLPTLAYYREHPDELSQQKKQIRKQIHEFQPIDCN